MGLRWMIQRYTPYVSAVVWGVFGGRLIAQDAEEVTSDAFLLLWRRRGALQAGKVKSYLGAIARRLNMSPEAVRQRLSRGRGQLQRMFEEEERAQ